MVDKKQDQLMDRIFNVNRGQGQAPSMLENAKLLIAEWLHPKHIKYKTRYNRLQVRAVATLQSLADKYHIKTLNRYLKEFRITKLSENSKSSEELEAILKSRTPEVQENSLEKLQKFLD